MLFNLLLKIFRRADSRSDAPDNLSDELTHSYQQIRVLAEQGEWLELEHECREILAGKSDAAEALTLLAYSLQQQNRLAEAADFATRAAILLPSDWHPNFISGVALKGLGKAKEACEYLRHAAAIAPNDVQTRRQLVEAAAVSEGVRAAALEYAAACHQSGSPVDVIAATVRTIPAWAHLSGLSLSQVSGQKQTPIDVPQTDSVAPSLPLDLSNSPHVADMTDIRIFSGLDLLLTSDGIAISDIDGHPQYGSLAIAQEPGMLLLDLGKFDTREIEVGVLLCGETSSTSDYWLLAFLPKLQDLQQLQGFADLPIIVDAHMPQSHFDHLERLVSNPLILLKANESLLCRRLLVAPTPSFLPVLEDLQQVRLLAEQRDWIELEERCRKMLIDNSELAEPMALLAFSLQQQGQLTSLQA
jgi:tetratricopeptide (TPR) repeat protein